MNPPDTVQPASGTKDHEPILCSALVRLRSDSEPAVETGETSGLVGAGGVLRFTLGPWETGSGDCHTVYGPKRKGRQRIVAKCPTQEREIEYDSQESFANARLISSAPELFDALTAIVAFSTPLPCGLLEQAQAALAKAGGGGAELVRESVGDSGEKQPNEKSSDPREGGCA